MNKTTNFACTTPHDIDLNMVKQAEKLKSCKMKEGWMKNDDGWMKNDEGWNMKDEGSQFQAVEGFCFRTNGQTNRHLWL